jgi:hypothetical protein
MLESGEIKGFPMVGDYALLSLCREPEVKQGKKKSELILSSKYPRRYNRLVRA